MDLFLIQRVFRNLKLKDLHPFCLVCKDWKMLIDDEFTMRNSTPLFIKDKWYTNRLKALKNFKKIQHSKENTFKEFPIASHGVSLIVCFEHQSYNNFVKFILRDFQNCHYLLDESTITMIPSSVFLQFKFFPLTQNIAVDLGFFFDHTSTTQKVFNLNTFKVWWTYNDRLLCNQYFQNCNIMPDCVFISNNSFPLNEFSSNDISIDLVSLNNHSHLYNCRSLFTTHQLWKFKSHSHFSRIFHFTQSDCTKLWNFWVIQMIEKSGYEFKLLYVNQKNEFRCIFVLFSFLDLHPVFNQDKQCIDFFVYCETRKPFKKRQSCSFLLPPSIKM